MNKVLIFALGSAAGAAVGSLVTWKLLEKKYKDLADEEIASVVERFKDRNKDKKENDNEYSTKLTDLGYTNNTKDIDDNYTVEIEETDDTIAPYVIAPEEFGEIGGYDTKSWTCYADGILTDEIGHIVSDPENIIGDGLDHFGDYEDDSVFVRNENNECDYEILKHEKAFSELNRGND